MRHSDGSTRPAEKTADPKAPPNSKRPRRLRRWGIFFLVLVMIGAVGRALLPWAVRDYVNRTLDRNPLYAGKIGQVQIHLWRGAYSILDVSLSKTTGNVPVPFFAAKRIDFALQWNALFHRKVVGRLLMEQPELNFVDAPEDNESQTGQGGPWLQMIRDLFPFTINSASIQNGSVHFRAYQTKKPVDVYLANLQGSIDNLSNIGRETNPLVATVQATASVMEQANLR